MNVLKTACLSRLGRILSGRSSPCPHCGPAKVPVPVRNEQSKLVVKNVDIFLRKTCYKSLSLTSRSALLTQVRYSKYPRFHRDLEFPSFADYRKDPYVDVRETCWGQGGEKQGATYALGLCLGMAGMYAAKSVCTYLVSSMSAAADVLALASVEIDLTKVAPGACDIVKWRGKPLFIKHRTQADIDAEKDTPLSSLRDPEAPDVRAPKPEWLIVIGICTHLGCVPIANTGDYTGGYYCPCHGSHYDNLGRIRKGPAPLNLVIPPYKFLTDSTVLVG